MVTGPAHGTPSGTAPNLTYTPAANYKGPDSFTFSANDGQATSAPATVSIAVTHVNHAPVANAQSVTTAEDAAVAITLTGLDVGRRPVDLLIVNAPAHGTLSGTAPNLTYTPAPTTTARTASPSRSTTAWWIRPRRRSTSPSRR